MLTATVARRKKGTPTRPRIVFTDNTRMHGVGGAGEGGFRGRGLDDSSHAVWQLEAGDFVHDAVADRLVGFAAFVGQLRFGKLDWMAYDDA